MGSTDIIREFIQEELVKDKINRIVGVGDDLIKQESSIPLEYSNCLRFWNQGFQSI